MGQSPDGKSYNENKEGIIFYQGCTDFYDRFPKERLYTTALTRFAEIGDVLLSVRALVGTMNIANTKCCIGHGLAALNSKEHHNCCCQRFNAVFQSYKQQRNYFLCNYKKRLVFTCGRNATKRIFKKI
jgi:hypothetical protein